MGPFSIGGNARPLVIAEAGINHNGDVELAKQLIREAKQAGADIVKFQTHIADAEMLPDRVDAGSHVTKSLYEIMQQCGLSREAHLQLKAETERNDILFLSTPFSIEAADLLEEIGVPAFKIGSGEVTNLPFLRYIAQKKKPILLSTGTGTLEDVARAVETIRAVNPNLVLMQCTSNYPTAYQDVNLGVLNVMQERFGTPVGLSDHCTGNYACFGAVAKGACIVEKHFTLSRRLPGVDQSSSIEPHELRDLVQGVRNVWEALGTKKELNDEARKVRDGFSESVVTIAPIKRGDRFVERENIWVKRPGTGIPSYELPKIVGKEAARDLPANHLLHAEDIRT
jgi:sialic acid synthase SpsE